MKKMMKWIAVAALLVMAFQCGTLLADKQSLHDDLIRLHVVANSDSQEDQSNKLLVRDAVVEYLSHMAECVTNREQAELYLRERLPQIQSVANKALQKAGSQEKVTVTLTEEAFDTREYDTFSLPAGIYESLRIQIGSGGGKNWWCVAFPSLCIPATTQEFQDAAVSAGFEDSLTNTLAGETGYEFRFFFLDCLGKLENFFKS